MSTLKFIFVSLFLVTSCKAVNFSDRNSNANASYRVIFEANWTESRFPTNFPIDNDHFSGLIGATHNNQVNFWRAGKRASRGIENVAETGSKNSFEDEIQIQKNNNTAEFLLSGGGLGFGMGDSSVDFEFDINKSHPLVTLISMLAPSPDWFVGVHDLSLLNSRGQWKNRLEVNLKLYDAGTDSGDTFSSFNSDSSEFIQLLTSRNEDTDFTDGVNRRTGNYIGTFIFQKIR
ncbi:MAG: hypothetical protein HAW60_01420 [Bdellovibrionales bacterium]|nr:hypothetical protein [Bdellovibrionales bacterium]